MFGDFSKLAEAGDVMAAKFAQVVDLLQVIADHQARTNELLAKLVETHDE